jgi:hypothetical protein
VARRLRDLLLHGKNPEVFQAGDWNPPVHYPGGGGVFRVLLWLDEAELDTLVKAYAGRLAFTEMPQDRTRIQEMACDKCMDCPWVGETGGCLAPEDAVGFPASMLDALNTCPIRKPENG